MLKLKDLQVCDVMSATPQSLDSGATVREAVRFLTNAGLNGAPVVDGDRLLGTVTRTELLAALVPALEGGDGAPQASALGARTLAQLGVPVAVTVDVATGLAEACKLMVKHRVRLLVVTCDQQPVGVISTTDAVRTIACLDELSDVTTPLVHFHPFQEGEQQETSGS